MLMIGLDNCFPSKLHPDPGYLLSVSPINPFLTGPQIFSRKDSSWGGISKGFALTLQHCDHLRINFVTGYDPMTSVSFWPK